MTTEELNALIAKAEGGDVAAMNRLTHIYGEVDGFINYEQSAKWFLELIKRDCDPNSGVYENTGYNKERYEKIRNAVLNSTTEEEMMSSLSGGNGGSLFGGAMYFTTLNAKIYINAAIQELEKYNIRKQIFQTVNESLINVIADIKEKIREDLRKSKDISLFHLFNPNGYLAELNNLVVHVSPTNDIKTNIKALRDDIRNIRRLKRPKEYVSILGGDMDISSAIRKCASHIQEVLPEEYQVIKFIVCVDEKSIHIKDEGMRAIVALRLKYDVESNMEALENYIFEILEKFKYNENNL